MPEDVVEAEDGRADDEVGEGGEGRAIWREERERHALTHTPCG